MAIHSALIGQREGGIGVMQAIERMVLSCKSVALQHQIFTFGRPFSPFSLVLLSLPWPDPKAGLVREWIAAKQRAKDDHVKSRHLGNAQSHQRIRWFFGRERRLYSCVRRHHPRAYWAERRW